MLCIEIRRVDGVHPSRSGVALRGDSRSRIVQKMRSLLYAMYTSRDPYSSPGTMNFLRTRRSTWLTISPLSL